MEATRGTLLPCFTEHFMLRHLLLKAQHLTSTRSLPTWALAPTATATSAATRVTASETTPLSGQLAPRPRDQASAGAARLDRLPQARCSLPSGRH